MRALLIYIVNPFAEIAACCWIVWRIGTLYEELWRSYGSLKEQEGYSPLQQELVISLSSVGLSVRNEFAVSCVHGLC